MHLLRQIFTFSRPLPFIKRNSLDSAWKFSANLNLRHEKLKLTSFRQFTMISSRRLSYSNPRIARPSPANPPMSFSVKPFSTPYSPLFHSRKLSTEPRKPEESPESPEQSNPEEPILEPSKQSDDIFTIPNMLTMSRLLLTPVLSWAVVTHQSAFALGLFFYCAVTDVLDGWIARKWSLSSKFGSIIDPIADKVLIITMTLSLYHTLPSWLIAIIIGRDVALLGSGFIYRYVTLQPPRTWQKYWDASTLEVKPTNVSKANTLFQLILLGNCILFPVLGWDVGMLWPLHYLVGLTCLWSWGQYAWYFRTTMRSGKI